MKIVINVKYGGFAIPDAIMSTEAQRQAALIDHDRTQYYAEKYPDNLQRHDPEFVAKIEALTKEQRGDLRVIEIPDGSYYVIGEYNGIETVYYSYSPVYTA